MDHLARLLPTTPEPQARSTGRCAKLPKTEVMLNSMISGLLRERLVPNGTIVDAGAADGRFACFFAASAPDRVVHAVDPDEGSIRKMPERWGAYPNLLPMRGGLGNASSIYRVDSKQAQRGEATRVSTSASSSFPIYGLDDLFLRGRWQGEQLGLGHFDVEGWELAVLQGGRAVIDRDQPLITAEIAVHKRPETTRLVLQYLQDELGYDSYLVEEMAGQRADIRNVLSIPRSRRYDFQSSATLSLAVQARVLLMVTNETISEHAFPCCKRGGACCPLVGPGGSASYCCSLSRVHKWMNRVVRRGGEDLQWSTRTTWYDQHWHILWPGLFEIQQQERLRNASTAGLSFNKSPLRAMRRAHRDARRED